MSTKRGEYHLPESIWLLLTGYYYVIASPGYDTSRPASGERSIG